MVSARVSPLEMEVMDISETSMTSQPSLSAALSKESLVRVEGSKKRLPRILPSSARLVFSPSAYGTIFSDRSRISSIRALVRSLIDTTSLSYRSMVPA